MRTSSLLAPTVIPGHEYGPKVRGVVVRFLGTADVRRMAPESDRDFGVLLRLDGDDRDAIVTPADPCATAFWARIRIGDRLDVKGFTWEGSMGYLEYFEDLDDDVRRCREYRLLQAVIV